MAKILLIGDKEVGKTSIKEKLIEMHASTENQTTKLQLVEINSDIEQMVLFRNSVFSDVKAIILVFDVTDIQTLNYIRRVQNKLMILLSNNKIPGILIGNKIDQRNEFIANVIHVSPLKGVEVANELSKIGGVFFKIPYFECSVFHQETIEQIFKFIITKLQGFFRSAENH